MLRTGTTGMLAPVVPEIDVPLFAELAREVINAGLSVPEDGSRTRKPSAGSAAIGSATNTPLSTQKSTEPLGSVAGPAANWLAENKATTASTAATAQLPSAQTTVSAHRGR